MKICINAGFLKEIITLRHFLAAGAKYDSPLLILLSTCEKNFILLLPNNI